MTNIIIVFVRILMGIILYFLLGAIFAGAYLVTATKARKDNKDNKDKYPCSPDVIGMCFIFWPCTILIFFSGMFFAKHVIRAGEFISNLFVVDNVEEKEM